MRDNIIMIGISILALIVFTIGAITTTIVPQIYGYGIGIIIITFILSLSIATSVQRMWKGIWYEIIYI